MSEIRNLGWKLKIKLWSVILKKKCWLLPKEEKFGFKVIEEKFYAKM